MAMIRIKRAIEVWGPKPRCVLCRAIWALLPSASPVDVPEEVAAAAVAAGAATLETGDATAIVHAN